MAVDAIANSTPTIPSTTITPKTTSTGATEDAKDATLNYDSFLKLLVAQMKNQDPTDPVDASEQMAQLASFSAVEQGIKTNKHLESLIQETSMNQATSLIGKTITSADGETKGVVKAVEVNTDGLTAILENGDEVLVSTGITIAATSTDTGTDTGTDPEPDTGEDTTPDDGES
jgi:flagellar basal-body rod modification protein FlgD